MKKIILASESKRRKRIMKDLFGDNFEICPSSYEEDNGLNLSPQKMVEFHAINKARDVAKKFNQGLVIGVDSMVSFDGHIFGKPKDKEDSIQMLKKQSGKKIQVYSGIGLIDLDSDIEIIDFEKTDLKIKNLSDDEILKYVQTGHGLDKAGAFGMMGKGSIFIEKIDGCFFNVIGFPVFKFNSMLKKLDIEITDYW